MGLICTFSALPNLVTYQILSHQVIFTQKTFCSGFLYVELWMANSNSKPLEIEDVYQYRYIEEPTCIPNEINIPSEKR